MTLKPDLAILKALSLQGSNTTLSAHSRSHFAFTGKITSVSDGQEKLYFVKTAKGKESEIMFTGEHMSLNAIHSAVPTLCPKSHAHNLLEESSGSFLVTDFLDLSSSSPKGSGKSLPEKLATLHSVLAPIPEGYDKAMFGFPVPTYCGDTRQDNSFKESWAEFYAENRLRGILRAAEKKNGKDPTLSKLLDQVAEKVVPRLLRDGHLRDGSTREKIKPVVVHGDLWSGNHGRGTIDAGGVEEVVFDPSSAWAHSEFEFGIMRMFGGFGVSFEKEYHELKPKDEPVEEWEDRVALYELYHHLNHYSIFGGGYRGGAVSIMEKLIKKYGK